jgi:mycothiol system anti-sigma-R factor
MNSPSATPEPDDDAAIADIPAHDHSEGSHDSREYCRDAIRDLYLYLDQELSSDQMAAVQIHLHECSPCFEAFGFEAELRMVIATRARDEAPEHLRERLLAMLRSLDPPPV